MAEGVVEAVVIPLGMVAVLAVVAVDPVAVGATVPEAVGKTRAVTDPVRRVVVPVTLLLLVAALPDRQVKVAMKKRMITTMTHPEIVVTIDELMPEPLTHGAPPSSRGKVTVPSSLGRRRTP